jgi:hypothetical protein
MFSPGPLPAGLPASLRHDAVAEGARLEMLWSPEQYLRLAALEAATARLQRDDPAARSEVVRWTRAPGSRARDGVPASCYPPTGTEPPAWGIPGRLTGRDFDLGRGEGTVAAAEGAHDGPPAATAVLASRSDSMADWLRTGQALHRLMVTAAASWVFASLSSQSLDTDIARHGMRFELGLTGVPQLVLQFGRAHSTEVTARRPVEEFLSLP